MNDQQKIAHYDTLEHIRMVSAELMQCIQELTQRSIDHDKSKLESPEMETFAEVTSILKTLPYGSKEYTDNLDAIKECIQHHYQNNRHHPEHFVNGVWGMTLIDVLEMVCDWKAAAKRTKGGDIYHSLKINKDRFNLSEELYHLLLNTVHWLDND